MRRRLAGFGLVVSMLAWGCAPVEDDEAVASDDAELTALEQAIGFDGAVARLDEAALVRVDAEAKTLEARRQDAGAIERAITRRVLVEARTRGASSSPSKGSSSIGVRAYDLDLLHLNGEESALCKSARIACVRVLIDGFRARGASQAEYRDGNSGGRIDAFRHTYWNALMVRSVGTEHAKAWADAHENGYPQNRASEGARLLSDMDFHNNAAGRTIGEARGDAKLEVRKALTSGVLRAVRYADGDDDVGVLVPTSECTDSVRCGR